MQISHKNLPGYISPTLFGKKSLNQYLELVLALAKSLTNGFKQAQEHLDVCLEDAEPG